MSDTKLSDYPANFLLLGLFVVCIIGFGGAISREYGMSTNVIDDGSVDYGAIENNVNQTVESANNWAAIFNSDNPFVVVGGVVVLAVYSIPKLVITLVINSITLFIDVISSITGVPFIVTAVVIALVVIGIVFAAIRLIKAGE